MKNTDLKRRMLLLIAAIVSIVCTISASASEKDDRRIVRVPCDMNSSLYIDEQGEPAGYCSDYLRRLSKINNWELEYVSTDWASAVTMLESGEIDILFPTSYLPEREETMEYSEIFGGYNIVGLFAKENSDYNYNDYSGFDGARVAITENSTNESQLDSFARERGFDYVPVYINSLQEKLEALAHGDVDMLVFSASDDLPDTKIISVINADPFYYTVKKGNTELLSELNSGMETIMMSEPDVAMKAFSSGMEGANSARLAFTSEEKEFIAKGEEMKIGFYQQTEPLAYVDSEGNYDGIYVQLLKRVGELSGLNITLYPISREDNWQDLIERGVIDFYIGASCTIVSSDGSYICAEPFMDYEAVLITKNDYRMPADGIENGTVALTQARSYWVENFPQRFEGMEVSYYPTAKDCLLAVKSGRADMTVLNTIEYNYQSKNSRFSDLMQWENYKFQSGASVATLPTTDELKVSVINKAMNALSDEEKNDIIDYSLNMPYTTLELADYIYSSRYFLIVFVLVIAFILFFVAAASVFRRNQRALERQAQAHERRQLGIMAALSEDYTAVYYLDLDNDTFTVEKASDRTRTSHVKIENGVYIFSKTMCSYIQMYVLPEYKNSLKTAIDRQSLTERLQKDRYFSIRYRTVPNQYGQEFFEINFSYGSPNKSPEDSENFAVMGFRCVDEIARVEIEQKRVLEEANEKLRRQMGIVGSLSSIYFVTLTGDLEEGTVSEVELPVFARPMIDEADGSLKKSFDIMAERFVKASSREAFLKFADLTDLPERIGDRSVISCDYQDIHSSWRRFAVIPMERDQNGRVVKAVFTVQIIDEEKQKELETQETLKSAFEAANNANHAKSDFLSRMSHDMRTPMNAIIGMTAIAGAHIDENKKVLDCLNKITTSSRHLLGLINEVLDMSKIESGKISLAEEEFNLSELLNNTITILQPDIKKHGHRLQVHLCNIVHEDVVGDSLRLQQVILNIMGNAIKYTLDRGSICLTVSERYARERMLGCYEFVVEDDGIGMSKEFIQHLFEPFSRAEDVRISKIQGTGLGMAITQNIVHMMNGDIRVESEIGKGSKFTVTIFLKLCDKNDDISTEELVGLPVLVADDDSIACETTCEILKEIGMNGEWVLSGMEAVCRVEETHRAGEDFYAVILDWQMPQMDGIETTRAIKGIVGDEIPIIILSAYDWSDIEDEAREAGVTAFISKPIFKSRLTRLFKTLKNSDGKPLELEPGKKGVDMLAKYDFSNKRALLVEDNELNREIAAEILKMTGMSIEEAENGREALDMFASSAEGHYDIVFMDIQMPVMNGLEAAEAIRALDRTYGRSVPIVAMTANAFTEDVQASKRAGMNEHLAKPIDFHTLCAVLKRYLK